jgi:hypothetical protein
MVCEAEVKGLGFEVESVTVPDPRVPRPATLETLYLA